MIKHIMPFGLSLLLAFAIPATAGQMYRYVTSNGSTVISRTLPPHISQRGYDVINDKTMSLIRHVSPAATDAEIAAMQTAKEDEKSQRIAEEERRKQAKKDAEFLVAYHSEESLIRDRDYELAKRDKELVSAQEKQVRLKSSLHNLQEIAADQELSGKELSKRLQSNLKIISSNLEQNALIITRLDANRIDRAGWYQSKLKQLRKIRAATEKPKQKLTSKN